jgi:hypothetical protein
MEFADLVHSGREQFKITKVASWVIPIITWSLVRRRTICRIYLNSTADDFFG